MNIEVAHRSLGIPDPAHSSLCEKMLEHAFLTDLSRFLWFSGHRDFEFLRAEVDRGGYDVVVECAGIVRHIQLKSRYRNGKADRTKISRALGAKPSGCVIWLMYDPATLELGPFYWFGAAPGQPLPDIGGKVARHTKGNKDGYKAERPAHGILRLNRFLRLETMGDVASVLFGSGLAPEPRGRSSRRRGGCSGTGAGAGAGTDDEGGGGGDPGGNGASTGCLASAGNDTDNAPAFLDHGLAGLDDGARLLLNPATRLWAGVCLQKAIGERIRPRSVLDQAVGTLLGLAVGDALGATLEFSGRDEKPHHSEMLGGGPFGLAPGEWTDDTAMALALADSLLSCRFFDPHDLVERFVGWWKEGTYSSTGECFDIGTTTREALARFQSTGDPYAGLADEAKAGNGSLMRLAPAVLFACADRKVAMELARRQSLTTHAAPQAVEACAYLALILCEAIGGYGKDALGPRPWEGHPAIRAIAAGEWRGKPREAIRSTGYVVDTLEAALWCVERTDSFEEALVLAVNLGGDSDTVGAVTGQLAGALYGASTIPRRWLEPLAWRERIEATALKLCGAGEV